MNSYSDDNLTAIAKLLGQPQGLQPEPFVRPVQPQEIKRFLTTKDGQSAVRAAIEQVIMTKDMDPTPPSEKILNTIKQMIGGGGI